MSIAGAVFDHAAIRPDALAAVADGETLSYSQFAGHAGRLGSWLVEQRAKRIAILGSRSLGAFIGVIGAAWAGAAYVPLSLKTPTGRLTEMLDQVRPDVVLIDRHGALMVDEVLATALPKQMVAADDMTRSIVRPVLGHIPMIADLGARSIPPTAVPAEDTAYIMFTSGTTGVPKGVVVSFGAYAALVEQLVPWYDIGPDDRVAATTDVSFDLSVSNMILAWHTGASLHALPVLAATAPARFIRSNRISVWNSVPAVIAAMMRTGALRPAIFKTLRYSTFIGEALSVDCARAWQAAAPGSKVDNMYGPTEATYACLGQIFDATTAQDTENVPIGRPFATSKAMIVDGDLKALGTGQRGELALAGPQLADGYLDRPDLTDARFPTIRGERWYLTGDAACQDEDGLFHHLGRLDNQLKVRGYRVELEDIEIHVRAASGAMSAAVIGWPHGKAAVDRLIGFTVGATQSRDETRAALGARLPTYMIPQTLHPIEAMPLTANGKLDRGRLVGLVPDLETSNG